MQELKVSRVEKKYEVSLVAAEKLKAALDATLTLDEHSSENGYMVRSLYFDTIYDDDLTDKESGLECRQKIRLRCYSPDAQKVNLERKSKKGQYQYKQSLLIDREDAKAMLRGEYDFLAHLDNDFARELYLTLVTRMYRPKVIVEYTRRAYTVCGNSTRITLDSSICGTMANLDLFEKSLALTQFLTPTVLEVKYDNFLLGYVKNLVNMADKMETSMSKYALARRNSYI